MWTHCIVCSSDLGSNQDLEAFPIGGRLAFDASKGRLWVVCPRCERWNLVPLEERWEAVEALERAFRETPTRYSTAEIGLARLRGGMEMVRIGNPVPGEFAAWRWGSRFGRRKRRLASTVKRGKLFKLESGTAWAAGIALAPLAPFLAPVALLGGVGYLISRLDARWPMDPVNPFRIGRAQLRAGGITPSGLFPGWSIHVLGWEREKVTGGYTQIMRWREFTGEDALGLARRALPLLNGKAPRLVTVSEAVEEISVVGGVDRYLLHAASLKPKWVAFKHYPKPILLAMEMALFEEEERRALEGELERLESAWREAEELAAISDDLLPPKGWEAFRTQVKAAGEKGPG